MNILKIITPQRSNFITALCHGCVKRWVCALELARPRGFEPLTLGLENRCSIKNPLKTNIRHKIIQQNAKNFDRIATGERQTLSICSRIGAP